MQTLEELLKEKEELTEKILKTISDMRADPKVKETVKKLFDAFPECGAIVMMAAYKGDNGERFVYDFSEIEESIEEGLNDLVTINSWIANNRPARWEPEIDKLFDELASVFPAPIQEEFDWDAFGLDEKKEIIIWREDV